MKRWTHWALLAGLVFGTGALAARQHDPLTQEEIDQLRDVALEPEKRLKLLADFASSRLTTIEQSRTQPAPTQEKSETTSPRPLHDLMEDFLAVYDEMDENIGMYEGRQTDLRKALKLVLVADSEFHARLEGLQHNLTPEERAECDFVMSTIVDAVTSATLEHKKLLVEQEAAAKNKKKK